METPSQIEKRKEKVRRILDTATKVFAEVGFAGARMDEIAKRAKVNKATIYYSIGDKVALYGRVLHEVFSDTAERIAENIRRQETPEKKLRTFIRNLARTMEENPNVPPIMMRELASGASSFPQMVASDFGRIIGMLMEILEEGRKKGVFIETNPLVVHLMLVGALMLLRASEPIRKLYLSLREISEPLAENISKAGPSEVETLLLRAVKTDTINISATKTQRHKEEV